MDYTEKQTNTGLLKTGEKNNKCSNRHRDSAIFDIVKKDQNILSVPKPTPSNRIFDKIGNAIFGTPYRVCHVLPSFGTLPGGAK